MPRHRDPDIKASPFAHKWIREHPEAAANLKRVVRLLLDHYTGDDHGYINRASNEVEYRFAPVLGDSISWNIQLVARAKHVVVRFPLYRSRRRGPWRSKTLKSAQGDDYFAIDVAVRSEDELDDLKAFIKTTKTFSGTGLQSGHRSKLDGRDGERLGDATNRRRSLIGNALARAEETVEANSSAIDSEEDARQRSMQAVVVRRGQAKFRQVLIKAYQSTCAVTGCAAVDVLEAAHIIPYLGEHTNRPDNGLLLRSDIHTLFDLGRLWIDADKMQVCIADELRQTEYGKFHGRALKQPAHTPWRPRKEHLRSHAKIAQQNSADRT